MTKHERSEIVQLRDWFAGMIMCGLEMRADYDAGLKTPEQRAHIAYVDADAMLKERSKSK